VGELAVSDAVVERLNVKGLADQAAAALSQKGLPQVGGLVQRCGDQARKIE
jgi:hypothetical protein